MDIKELRTLSKQTLVGETEMVALLSEDEVLGADL